MKYNKEKFTVMYIKYKANLRMEMFMNKEKQKNKE